MTSKASKPSKNPQSSRVIKRNSNKRKTPRAHLSSIPAAFGSSETSFAYISGSGPVSNLVCQEIFSVKSTKTGAFILPICPTKWSGTRTQVLASTYTAHRPLELQIRWVPSVSTSTPGMVAVGTVFDGARINLSGTFDADCRTLAATNGGVVSTVWKPTTTKINLKRNLRANNFPLYEVSDDDIPLWVVCVNSVEQEGVIGQLMVRAKFTLRNPAMNASIPTSWSGVATLTRSGEETTMKIDGQLEPKPSLGNMYNFAFGKNLLDDSGTTIAQALQAVSAQVTGVDPVIFALNQPFSTQSAYGSVIGLANF